jgi:hypothetical protein
MDGFDLGDSTVRFDYTGTLFGSSTTTAFTYGRSVSNGGNQQFMKKAVPAASIVYSGVRFFPGQAGGLIFFGDSGATQHVTVAVQGSGAIQIYRGNMAGTLLATAVPTWPLSTWGYLEVSCSISDTVGYVEVRKDGSATPVVTFTGDTKNAGTSSTIDAVGLITASSTPSLFDDWYICDNNGTANNTWLGDVRVMTLAPNGNGASSQFLNSASNFTNNYTYVDEQPYSAADYVGSTTTGDVDTYTMADVSQGTIFGVQPILIAAKPDAGLAQIKQVVRSGATNYTGTTKVLSTTFTSYTDAPLETDPATSAAWTQSGVNAVEVGVQAQ